MNTMRASLKTLLLSSLICVASHAEIAATNLSGHNLRVSLHGDGCRHFDGDRYNYPACAEQTVGVNETVSFKRVFPGQQLSPREKLVSPKIVFSVLGFSYVCRLSDFVELQVCSFINYLDEDEEPQRELGPSPLDLIGSAGLQLSLEENYHLSILPGWRLYPTPQVDCTLARVHEVPARCGR